MTRVTGKTPATGCPHAPGAAGTRESKGHRGPSSEKRISNCCLADALHSRGTERAVRARRSPALALRRPQSKSPPGLGTCQPTLSVGFFGGIHVAVLFLTCFNSSSGFSCFFTNGCSKYIFPCRKRNIAPGNTRAVLFQLPLLQLRAAGGTDPLFFWPWVSSQGSKCPRGLWGARRSLLQPWAMTPAASRSPRAAVALCLGQGGT